MNGFVVGGIVGAVAVVALKLIFFFTVLPPLGWCVCACACVYVRWQEIVEHLA